MRGQKLFVRPIEAADADPVEAFLRAEGQEWGAPALGLVGKLVGNLVSVVSLEREDHALRITNVFVTRELRRKRIGRYMLDEAAALARGMNLERLVADHSGDAAGFLRRVGFVEEEGRMVRWLR